MYLMDSTREVYPRSSICSGRRRRRRQTVDDDDSNCESK